MINRLEVTCDKKTWVKVSRKRLVFRNSTWQVAGFFYYRSWKGLLVKWKVLYIWYRNKQTFKIFDTQKCLGLKIFWIFAFIFLTSFRPKNLWALRILNVCWFLYQNVNRIEFLIDFDFGFGFGSTPGTQYILFFGGEMSG